MLISVSISVGSLNSVVSEPSVQPASGEFLWKTRPLTWNGGYLGWKAVFPQGEFFWKGTPLLWKGDRLSWTPSSYIVQSQDGSYLLTHGGAYVVTGS